MERKIWTISEVQEKALIIGKEFKPNSEIADRLADDLANGALVLFSEQDVLKAIADGEVPLDYKDGLLNLVNKLNDIAVIPAKNK